MEEIKRIGDFLVEFHLFWGYEIIAYLGKEKNLTVPTKLSDEDVALIGCLAFSPRNPYIDEEQREFLKNSLETVTFEQEHLKTMIKDNCIRCFAFAGCHALKNFVPTDRPALFYPDCPQLFPSESSGGTLTNLAKAETFGYHLSIPSGYHTVGTGVAMGKVLTDVYISEGVEKIEACAFANIQYLETVWLPSTLRYVAPNAFANCPSLSEECRNALSAYITPNPLTAKIDFKLTKNEKLTKKCCYTLTVTDTKASDDFVLYTLTEDTATVYLKRANKTVTLPLGQETVVTYCNYDIGSIIEGERYYESEDTYTYALTLLKVK